MCQCDTDASICGHCMIEKVFKWDVQTEGRDIWIRVMLYAPPNENGGGKNYHNFKLKKIAYLDLLAYLDLWEGIETYSNNKGVCYISVTIQSC